MSGKDLLIASDKGNIVEVRRLLRMGVHPDKYRDAEWYHGTALMVASSEGHVDIVKTLLQAYSDIHITGDDGYTALHWASQCGHVQVVQELLAAGSVLDVCDHKQCTPLHKASKNGNLEVVRVLVEAGASVSARDDLGHTALTLAALNGHSYVVEYLLSHGSWVQEASSKGFTALHIASQKGHCNVAKVLLRHGAGTHVKNIHNNTSLHQAAYSGHLNVVKLLLEEGGAMDTLKWPGYNGQTALQLAHAKGHREIVTYLQAAEHGEIQVEKPKCDIEDFTDQSGSASMQPLGKQKSDLEDVTDKSGSASMKPVVTRGKADTDALGVKIGAASIGTSGSRELVLDKEIGAYVYSDSSYLGGGTFADVYKGQHKSGGEMLAVKIIKWKVYSSDPAFDPSREAITYKSLPPHKNIVRYIDHIFLPMEKKIAIIMELCPLGDMEGYFINHVPSLAERVDLMVQACEGLSHLHSQTPVVVHRDLKPGNMLMTRSGVQVILKLGDFGLARFDDSTFLHTFGGTANYLAPEVLPTNDQVRYTKEVDIFSLGLVYQAMLNFRHGDTSLKPILESKPEAKEYIAREMKNADILGQPMPAVVVLRDDEDFTTSRIKTLIKHMTRYKVPDRIQLSLVQKELKSLNYFLKQ